jgi:SAM-dependent methyltransferase
MLPTEIAEFYAAGAEDDRLAAGRGLLEFLRTMDVLRRSLPPAPADVVDVGGATGVYAGPLAEAGYRVHVVDPLPRHVAAAGALPGVEASLGDARDLPRPDASADAVLLFGPLYHLTGRGDRVRAWREAARVVRPGGVVVASVIGRWASMLDGFSQGHYAGHPVFRSMVEAALGDGTHRNLSGDPRHFTTAYFHRPQEVAAEVTEAGLPAPRLVPCEGPLVWCGRLDRILADPGERELMLDLLRRVEDEPSLLGATSHLLAVTRRPADDTPPAVTPTAAHPRPSLAR